MSFRFWPWRRPLDIRLPDKVVEHHHHITWTEPPAPAMPAKVALSVQVKDTHPDTGEITTVLWNTLLVALGGELTELAFWVPGDGFGVPARQIFLAVQARPAFESDASSVRMVPLRPEDVAEDQEASDDGRC